MKIMLKFLQPIFYLFFKSPLAGAQTTLNCIFIDYEKLISGGWLLCKLQIKQYLQISNG